MYIKRKSHDHMTFVVFILTGNNNGFIMVSFDQSLNGTFVNGQQLKPSTECTLQEGDLVQFGVPVSPNTTAEFVYKFFSSLKVCFCETNRLLPKLCLLLHIFICNSK